MLNHAARDEGMDHWPFRRVHFGDSKSDPLFEINDLHIVPQAYIAGRLCVRLLFFASETALVEATLQGSPHEGFTRASGLTRARSR